MISCCEAVLDLGFAQVEDLIYRKGSDLRMDLNLVQGDPKEAVSLSGYGFYMAIFDAPNFHRVYHILTDTSGATVQPKDENGDPILGLIRIFRNKSLLENLPLGDLYYQARIRLQNGNTVIIKEGLFTIKE